MIFQIGNETEKTRDIRCIIIADLARLNMRARRSKQKQNRREKETKEK
jgi:hypothetical protein